MFCPKCGTKNIDGAKFCTACGNPLVSASAAPVQQNPAPGASPAAQGPAPKLAKAPGAKKKAPIIIGAAAAVVVIALVAVFVVIPAFNKNPFKGAQVGDMVEFGSYEQDGDTSNGKEPIEWRVLTVEGNRALVVSDKALDAHCFNSDEDKGNKWESSDLKNWLDNDFATQAFTDEDKKVIDGAPTLLSADEADKYFKSDKDRECYPTKQLKSKLNWDSDDDSACYWWLRSPGANSFGAAIVNYGGGVYSDGFRVGSSDGAVRPALWVNL